MPDTAIGQLFEPHWLDTYEKSIDAIWWQLVKLNSTLLILDKIISFPFELFENPPSHFWRLVEDALLESSVMTIWRVALDPDPRVLTLGRLRAEALAHVRTGHAARLKAELERQPFEERFAPYRAMIRDIRHNYAAHFNLDRLLRRKPEELREDKELLRDLMACARIANDYFDCLCFGRRRALLPWGYQPAPDGTYDIDGILSRIAQASAILNAAESNPALWPGIRQALSREQIDTLNHYRRGLGLPDI